MDICLCEGMIALCGHINGSPTRSASGDVPLARSVEQTIYKPGGPRFSTQEGQLLLKPVFVTSTLHLCFQAYAVCRLHGTRTEHVVSSLPPGAGRDD
jgi:hypothetical protein